MPERVTSVGVVACPAPTDASGVFEGVSKTNRFFMKLAGRAPWLSELNIRFLASMIRHSPERYISTMKYKVHDVDKAVLAHPGVEEMLVKDFTEALRSGSKGTVDVMNANHGRPWGFPLNEIRAQVHVWSCELDLSVSPAMGRYLSETIPNCEITLVPNAGHLWILEHVKEVLDVVAPAQHT